MKTQSAYASAIVLLISHANVSIAEEPLLGRVSSCKDVRTYIDTDQSMTMESFKKLVAAADAPLTEGESRTIDNECKVSAFVKNTLLSQHLLRKADGGEIRLTARVTMDAGLCRLVDVSIAGC